MRITLTDSPRKLARLARPSWIHARVISGAATLAEFNQDILDGGGLPITVSDGIVSLKWECTELWIAGNPAGSVVEVIVP